MDLAALPAPPGVFQELPEMVAAPTVSCGEKNYVGKLCQNNVGIVNVILCIFHEFSGKKHADQSMQL